VCFSLFMGSFVIFLYLLCYFNEKFEALLGRSSVQKKKMNEALILLVGHELMGETCWKKK
jgi:hypothetical protein